MPVRSLDAPRARGIFAPSPRLDDPQHGHAPGMRLLRNSLKLPQGPNGKELTSMKERATYYGSKQSGPPGTAPALPPTPVPKRTFDSPLGFDSSLPRGA